MCSVRWVSSTDPFSKNSGNGASDPTTAAMELLATDRRVGDPRQRLPHASQIGVVLRRRDEITVHHPHRIRHVQPRHPNARSSANDPMDVGRWSTMAGYGRMHPAPHTYAQTENAPEVNRAKPSVAETPSESAPSYPSIERPVRSSNCTQRCFTSLMKGQRSLREVVDVLRAESQASKRSLPTRAPPATRTRRTPHHR